ncbi:hypothetical protein [Pseudolysinimonas sp.]
MSSVSPAEPPSATYLTMEAHLSSDRLAPYLATAGGNFKLAVKLYQWNIALSGATYEGLHVFEVILRNAIDARVAQWNATQLNVAGQPHSAEWLRDPAKLLRRLVPEDDRVRMLSRASTALGRRRVPNHSDLIAQSTFGTWRFLLPDNDPGRQYLWTHAVSSAFPNLTRTSRELTSDVDDVYSLRNRVAHLEPILLGGVVNARYEAMRRVLGEISTKAEQWFVSNQRITAVISQRPTL